MTVDIAKMNLAELNTYSSIPLVKQLAQEQNFAEESEEDIAAKDEESEYTYYQQETTSEEEEDPPQLSQHQQPENKYGFKLKLETNAMQFNPTSSIGSLTKDALLTVESESPDYFKTIKVRRSMRMHKNYRKRL